MATAYTYLDAEALDMIIDLMDGDTEMIIDLVDTLLESAPEDMTRLEEGLEALDAHEVREAAHALKSANAQLGALQFSELCKTCFNIPLKKGMMLVT